MSNSQKSPVWLFMAATAMATTVSTLAATAMVKADASEPVEVACACQTPAPVVQAPAPAEAPACEAPAPATPEELTPEELTPEEAPEQEQRVTTPKRGQHTVTPSASVEGALDKDIIRRIVRAHINEIRYCYNEGLQRNEDLAGRVAIQFTVGKEGKVTSSHVSEDSLDDEAVSSCMAEAVGRWMFPRPADGEDVVITYPFVLEPG
ncbi:AgmX/PglI C-terminal domain-containing protein [Paraliomyxa miuraensis]|uniref:AgmX/PglI C-terminal domain-containing protein n=1 Tax=Paraliomyxa miuraensis TaxID=376150 RepID=UPI0022513546|nr:AgmX/PglI C-terminal domain-containing protein [Paraliomyxa miuraensis]MCX4240670.1 AgmX/PglI C-terminal domain-containing protein [Paraliomyxa miuraensis]